MCARDQSSIFSAGGKFRPDYGILLELHALTLVARSYALLTREEVGHLQVPCNCFDQDQDFFHYIAKLH